jgi:UDP-N-acetylglucosamine 1-carboxyvinyltransferase
LGARIDLKFPSVGATENALLAGVLARGTTTITNAALEPEVVDLIKLLQKMGAIIGLGSGRTIVIEGVTSLHGARHRILPDRNEAVSFGVLGVASGGSVRVAGAVQGHLMTFLNTIRKAGGRYDVEDGGIVFSGGALKAVEVETDAHPGFMTDWQQPLSVLLTQANGTSVIHETIYEDRFGYVDDLNAMGANIETFSKCLGELPCRFQGMGFRHSAVIHGPTPLTGTTMRVRDLRSGMAHVIAALVAHGTSVIEGVEEIDRGYERLDERLRALGAVISREV